jgi:hypothetical protein
VADELSRVGMQCGVVGERILRAARNGLVLEKILVETFALLHDNPAKLDR